MNLKITSQIMNDVQLPWTDKTLIWPTAAVNLFLFTGIRLALTNFGLHESLFKTNQVFYVSGPFLALIQIPVRYHRIFLWWHYLCTRHTCIIIFNISPMILLWYITFFLWSRVIWRKHCKHGYESNTKRARHEY